VGRQRCKQTSLTILFKYSSPCSWSICLCNALHGMIIFFNFAQFLHLYSLAFFIWCKTSNKSWVVMLQFTVT
jgi:hypothetical protein